MHAEQVVTINIHDIIPETEVLDLNVSDRRKRTALHLAAQVGDVVRLERLLELMREDAQHQQKLDAVDDQQKTALHYAVIGGHKACVKHLLAQGADLTLKSNSGQNVLHYAAQYGHGNCLELLLTHLEGFKIKEVLAEVDETGKSVMHYAVAQSSVKVVERLLAAGASVHTRDQRHNIPLHIAARYGHQEIAVLLVSQGSEIMARNGEGQTPYWFALRFGHEPLALWLLEQREQRQKRYAYEVTQICTAKSVSALENPTGSETRARKQALVQAYLADRYQATPQAEQGIGPAHEITLLVMKYLQMHDYDPKRRQEEIALIQSIVAADSLLIRDQVEAAKDLYEHALDQAEALQHPLAQLICLQKLNRSVLYCTPLIKALYSEEYTQLESARHLLLQGDLSQALHGFEQLLARAVEKNAYLMQVLALQGAAEVQLQQGYYLIAARLFTSALSLYQQIRPLVNFAKYEGLKAKTNADEEILLSSIALVEQTFLEQRLKLDKSIRISNMVEDYQGYRKTLAVMRAKVAKNLEDKAYPAKTIVKDITNTSKALLAKMIKAAMQILGKPPCTYAILGLGSMAREEMSFYSDWEFGILIDKDQPKNRTYFANLARLVELRIMSLGETHHPIYKRNFDDFSPNPRGVSLDPAGLAPLGYIDIRAWESIGEFSLIGTPEQLAAYQKRDAREVPIELLNALRIGCCVMGNSRLFNRFEQKLEDIIYPKAKGKKRDHTQQVMASLAAALEDFKPKLDKQKYVDRSFGVKKEFYRLLERIVSNLALFYQVTAKNIWERLDELEQKGILHQEGVKNLKNSINGVLRLRLKVQEYYGSEFDTVWYADPIDPAAQPKDIIYAPEAKEEAYKLSAEETDTLLKLYRTLLPLTKAIEKSCEQREVAKILQAEVFYDDSLKIQGVAEEQLLNYRQALACYEQTLALMPDDMEVLNRLADLQRRLGESRQGLIYLEKALALAQHQYGAQHPRVADALNNLGNAWSHLGEKRKAIALYEQALIIKRRAYLEQHPSIADGLNNLGVAWSHLGEHRKAIALYQEALEISRSIYGAQHPSLAISLDNLGGAWYRLGEHRKAIALYEEALVIKRSTYSEQHPDVADSLNNLANAWSYLGEKPKAIALYEQALKIFRNIYGAEHPSLAISLNNLGLIWSELGNSRKAVELNEQALMIRRKVYGEQHSEVADSLNNLGLAWSDLGEKHKARELHEQALGIFRSVYSDQHPSVAVSLNNLGLIWSDLGEKRKAIALYEQALEMFRHLYGEQHPSVAESLNNLGLAWSELGEKHQAIALYGQALAVFRNMYGAQHPSVAISLNNLGANWFALGAHSEAIALFEQALEIAQQKLGPDHPDTLSFQKNLNDCRLKMCAASSSLAAQNALFYQFQNKAKDLLAQKLPFKVQELDNTISIYLSPKETGLSLKEVQTQLRQLNRCIRETLGAEGIASTDLQEDQLLIGADTSKITAIMSLLKAAGFHVLAKNSTDDVVREDKPLNSLDTSMLNRFQTLLQELSIQEYPFNFEHKEGVVIIHLAAEVVKIELKEVQAILRKLNKCLREVLGTTGIASTDLEEDQLIISATSEKALAIMALLKDAGFDIASPLTETPAQGEPGSPLDTAYTTATPLYARLGEAEQQESITGSEKSP